MGTVLLVVFIIFKSETYACVLGSPALVLGGTGAVICCAGVTGSLGLSADILMAW